MKPTYEELQERSNEYAIQIEELEQERNELAAQWDRLRIAAATVECTLANSNFAVDGLDELQESLDEQPPAALAALKEQYQAEAVKDFLELQEDAGRFYGDPIEIIGRDIRKPSQHSQGTVMSEHKNVGTPGHADYESDSLRKEAAINICPTGHEAFHAVLKQRKALPLNDEPWRGKGKRRIPKGGL